MGAYRHRILKPVGALSSSKLLLQKQVPEQLPTPLANACRAVARQVLQVLEVDFAEPAIDVEEVEEVERLPAARCRCASRDRTQVALRFARRHETRQRRVPLRAMTISACARLDTPSARKMADMCTFTVPSDRPSASAISRLLLPSASSSVTRP